MTRGRTRTRTGDRESRSPVALSSGFEPCWANASTPSSSALHRPAQLGNGFVVGVLDALGSGGRYGLFGEPHRPALCDRRGVARSCARLDVGDCIGGPVRGVDPDDRAGPVGAATSGCSDLCHARAARGYALDTAHTLPPLDLTSGEVTAIATALSTVGATPFNVSGRSALRKILAVLRDVAAEGARALSERIYLSDAKQPAQPRPPVAVEQAVLEGRVLTLDYVDANGTATDRTVEPLVVIGDPPRSGLGDRCVLPVGP